MKTKKGTEYKSVAEAQSALTKLRSDRDAAMLPFKPKVEGEAWQPTRVEDRQQWKAMAEDMSEIVTLLSEQNELNGLSNAGEYKADEKPYEKVAREQAERRAANFPRGGYNPGGYAGEVEYKSLGRAFVESNEFKSNAKNGFNGKPTFSFVAKDGVMLGQGVDDQQFKSADVENTFFAPPNYRIPLIVTSAQRPAIIQTIIPTIATSERNAVPYMLETTFTNNAAPVAQTVALAVSRLDYTQQTMPINTIGTYIPVTEQMMEDVTGIMGLVNMRLSLMQEQTIETQLISGDGTGQNLTGYLNAPSIGHVALGSQDIYTCIASGLNNVRWTGYVEPDYVVLNSADMLTIRTKKDALGNFIFGPPNLQANEVIWGMPIVVTNGIASGTALTGAFKMMSARYIARGVTVEVGRINDNFVTLEWGIRITQRECLIVNRGSAFCYMDGFAAA